MMASPLTLQSGYLAFSNQCSRLMSQTSHVEEFDARHLS